MSCGVSAIVRLAAELEINLGMETLSIGRSAVVGEDCTLEICGTWLCYRIVLREGEVHVSASLMDDPSPPDLLLRAKDTASDWQVVRRLISSMERNGVKSLERPIESGFGDGDENWIIW